MTIAFAAAAGSFGTFALLDLAARDYARAIMNVTAAALAIYYASRHQRVHGDRP